MKSVSAYIHKGLVFIAKHQEGDGSFKSLSSPDADFSRALRYTSTFTTSLILSCLTPSLAIKNIQTKGIQFLLNQKSATWSWNYWKRNTSEAKKLPYPDDLDDTFCALAGLTLHQPNRIDGKALASIVSLLTQQEQKEGGPYRTWVVGPEAPEKWQDIDIAVNANIAYFLSLHDISLSGLNDFVENKINRRKYTSPYYPSTLPILYFIARSYRGSKKSKVIQSLHAQPLRNPLDYALQTTSLLRLGVSPVEVQKNIDHMMQSGWKAHPFCIDPTVKGKTHYAGSPALTAAFCIEAVALWQSKKITASPKFDIPLKQVIFKQAEKRFISSGTKDQSLPYLQKIIQGDTDNQIALLPYFFRESLSGANKNKISDGLITQLGLANLYGWTAYRIFDDFLDNEGQPLFLPVATLCLRELTTIYRTILPDTFYQLFSSVMDDLDAANAWEQQHCRFTTASPFVRPSLPIYKTYSVLAQKSLGHALGPVAILASLGYSTKSQEVKSILSFFQNYIIARQLNDDAHDWLKDLEKGFLSPASTQVLKKWKGSASENLASITPELQRIFWYKVIPGLSKDILAHIQKARRTLQKMKIIQNKEYFESILVPIENSARWALRDRKHMLDFLKSYSQK